MNSLLNWLFIFLVLIVALSMAYGVNMKKWYGWAQVFSGFLLGLLMGTNTAERMITGIFFAAMTVWLGSIVWKRWQQHKKRE